MLINILKEYWEGKERGEKVQAVYIRRRKETLTRAILDTVWDTITADDNGRNKIEEITNGEYDRAIYWSGEWHLAKKNAEGLIKKDPETIMYAVSLSTWANMKGAAYPFVQTIWFEEFMAVAGESYLPNEFSAFQQLLSTITRNRTNVKLWLTGNSVDIFCPYFDNLGLTACRTQEKGTILKFKLGKTDRIIAVERTDDDNAQESGVASKYLFAFDTEDTALIQNGDWQFGVFPLYADEIKYKDICARFYIDWKGKRYEGDVISSSEQAFIYIHADLDPIKPYDPDTELLYTREYCVNGNTRRTWRKPLTDAERIILMLWNSDRVFYDSNMTGFAIASFDKEALTGK